MRRAARVDPSFISQTMVPLTKMPGPVRSRAAMGPADSKTLRPVQMAMWMPAARAARRASRSRSFMW